MQYILPPSWFTNTFKYFVSLSFVYVLDLCCARCQCLMSVLQWIRYWNWLLAWLIFFLSVKTTYDPCTFICKLMNFGSPSPYINFVFIHQLGPVKISPWLWNFIHMSFSPLSQSLCILIILSYIWIPLKRMYNMITSSWRKIDLFSATMLWMQCFMLIGEHGFSSFHPGNFLLHSMRFWTLLGLECVEDVGTLLLLNIWLLMMNVQRQYYVQSLVTWYWCLLSLL